MEGIIDETSGRPLIEGRGCPIDGGVFRRVGNPGLVVDSKYFLDKPWFAEDDIAMASTNKNMLKFATFIASKRMPVNMKHFSELINGRERHDRYALGSFVSMKNDNGVEIGGGSPDVQALYTAFLIGRRIKNEPDRKVWVLKDTTDGHAIVRYEGKSGNYQFDPTNGDAGFAQVE